jgi:hypothetical protein
MAATTHCAPNASAARVSNSGSSTAAVLTDTLSAPARSRASKSPTARTPAADRQRHEADVSRPRHHVQQRPPPLMAGGDVQEHQLIGARRVVGARLLDWVARVAQIEEVDPLHHPPVLHVQAGDHANRQHQAASRSASAGLIAPV